jgi:hypothetical protein
MCGKNISHPCYACSSMLPGTWYSKMPTMNVLATSFVPAKVQKYTRFITAGTRQESAPQSQSDHYFYDDGDDVDNNKHKQQQTTTSTIATITTTTINNTPESFYDQQNNNQLVTIYEFLRLLLRLNESFENSTKSLSHPGNTSELTICNFFLFCFLMFDCRFVDLFVDLCV